ncbi:MAG: HAMP domain-containing histidine kinase [Marinilabiliaceae bacterium]|nr:HAMP domain-containing histidine kinase [Marinilabiliaceae bacterium]
MTMFSKLFHRKSEDVSNATKNYSDITEFVSENVTSLKHLLSSHGYNDSQKRLEDLADMLHCPLLLLCAKQKAMSSFSVMMVSDTQYDVFGKQFQWQHSQVAASTDAAQLLESLPFPKMGASSFISVPVKSRRNMLTGLLLGLFVDKVSNIEGKTQLLHLMSPLFESDLQVEILLQERQQYEQRISSLNQNIEIINTDLSREKEKSSENEELRRSFLMNLSHDIRTPMNVLLGFADMLDTAESDEERRSFIDIIKQNSRVMLSVIDNLVDISKVQSSYMFKAAVPSSLNKMLDGILEKYELQLKNCGKSVLIERHYGLEAPNDIIWNSDVIISKVMDALLDNACKFTQEGVINVSYVVDHKLAKFTVSDTGEGIEPGQEDKVFDMFSETEMMTSQREGFSGIGLSLAKKYVELASGRIWLDTSYTDGASFSFSIPMEKL